MKTNFSDLSSIIQTIERDRKLSEKVLKLVNSSYYAKKNGSMNHSVCDAVKCLGIKRTIEIIDRNISDHDSSDSRKTETINGDLRNSLVTDSNLIVTGNILSGCKVKCTANLAVSGAISGADINCNGNIKTQFVNNSRIECGKILTVENDIVDSNIKCRDFIFIGGKIEGGTVSADSGIVANIIESAGSSSGKTKIKVGLNHKLENLLENLNDELSEITGKCDSLNKVVDELENKDKTNYSGLTYTERKVLKTAKESLNSLIFNQLAGLETRYGIIKKKIDKIKEASIYIKRGIEAGTAIYIKNRFKVVRQNCPAGKWVLKGGQITLV